MKYIAIAGKIGSGKSLTAELFCKLATLEGWTPTITPLGAALKDIARGMGWNGVKDAKGRRLLQLLGGECGRECIGENVWINLWAASVEAFTGDMVIVDDMRYKNEFDYMDALGAMTIEVVGREAANTGVAGHASEAGLSETCLFTTRIANDGSVDDLFRKVEWAMADNMNNCNF